MHMANLSVYSRRQRTQGSDSFYLLPVPMEKLPCRGTDSQSDEVSNVGGENGDGDGVVHLNDLLSKVRCGFQKNRLLWMRLSADCHFRT